MFEPKIYKQRRTLLKNQLKSGLALFIGNEESPMNYPANTYHFRQDSSFLYFFGLDSPGLAAVIDVDENKDMIFGNDVNLEDIIWMGYQPKMKDRAKTVGVREAVPLSKLPELISQGLARGRNIHYLPPHREETRSKIAELLGVKAQDIKPGASADLIKAVVAQRSVKIDEEIKEIEKALNISHEMYLTAMKMTKPGFYERDVAGKIEGIALARGSFTAFPTILTINGQIFHNQYHGNLMTKGKLLVIDAGAESESHYASDITRTIPVSGKFSKIQKDIYELLLNAQESAIQSIKPGITYREIHLGTARIIASGMKDLGFMKGDTDEAVSQGAHALFFPHGLGHMLGLDVHDMENLGENYVGYDDTIRRSDQFGLAYLRMAKKLIPGYVLTVEPGIYFIPALIDAWKKENKHASFINYEKVEAFRDFSGIRIEDDILVTKEGHRVLGKKIPKKAKDIEKVMAG